MADDDPTDVLTVFLRSRGQVLFLRRSDEVGSSPGRWGGVAGHAEGDPDRAAREAIREETGIDPATLELVRRGDPFPVEDDEYARLVHPYLFDCPTHEVETNYETAESEWVPATEILRRETSETSASERRAGEARGTVPDLWTSYDSVRPTPETVANDTEHGSASLSLRALECLRDEAALAVERGGDWGDVASVARALLDARPSMAAVANRINRAMYDAGTNRTPAAVERAAVDGHRRAWTADAEAARPDPDWRRVLTLSRSGTVRRALLDAPGLERAFVAESRPAREGVGVAERLASGCDVTLHTDAAVAHVLANHEVDAVVVGADAVLADGSVVNKTGTRTAALAAEREGVPLRIVCAADKISPDADPHLESGPRGAVYDGGADLEVLNPTFDVTPPDLVSGVRTERGVLDTEAVRAVAREHAALRDWTGGR